jgi:hypothetical protein
MSNANDLEDLFNRQPPYSEADLARIVAHFRETRAQYASGVKPKKSTGAKSDKLDLDDIGLGSPKVEIEDIKL